MSALPPKADIAGRQLNVRFVPIADIAAPEPLERRLGRKSRPLTVNKDADGQRRKCKHDKNAAQYHSQPDIR
jgi:hypothetical protein